MTVDDLGYLLGSCIIPPNRAFPVLHAAQEEWEPAKTVLQATLRVSECAGVKYGLSALVFSNYMYRTAAFTCSRVAGSLLELVYTRHGRTVCARVLHSMFCISSGLQLEECILGRYISLSPSALSIQLV